MLQALRDFFHHPQNLWPTLIAALSLLFLIVSKGYPWVKEWYEFRKTVLKTQKLTLEVQELHDKRHNRLVVATDEEVIKYDRKTKSLTDKIMEKGPIFAWVILGLAGLWALSMNVNVQQ